LLQYRSPDSAIYWAQGSVAKNNVINYNCSKHLFLSCPCFHFLPLLLPDRILPFLLILMCICDVFEYKSKVAAIKIYEQFSPSLFCSACSTSPPDYQVDHLLVQMSSWSNGRSFTDSVKLICSRIPIHLVNTFSWRIHAVIGGRGARVPTCD